MTITPVEHSILSASLIQMLNHDMYLFVLCVFLSVVIFCCVGQYTNPLVLITPFPMFLIVKCLPRLHSLYLMMKMTCFITNRLLLPISLLLLEFLHWPHLNSLMYKVCQLLVCTLCPWRWFSKLPKYAITQFVRLFVMITITLTNRQNGRK